MPLYLMQHGEALSEDEDRARPLSERGRTAVTGVASRAAASGLVIETIVHSGKLRALQSAQLLSDALGTGHVTEHAGLAPDAPVVPVSEWLSALDESTSIAVVGHLPFLNRLASLLVTGDEDAEAIAFANGGLVALTPKSGRAGFSFAWALVPGIV